MDGANLVAKNEKFWRENLDVFCVDLKTKERRAEQCVLFATDHRGGLHSHWESLHRFVPYLHKVQLYSALPCRWTRRHSYAQEVNPSPLRLGVKCELVS